MFFVLQTRVWKIENLGFRKDGIDKSEGIIRAAGSRRVIGDHISFRAQLIAVVQPSQVQGSQHPHQVEAASLPRITSGLLRVAMSELLAVLNLGFATC